MTPRGAGCLFCRIAAGEVPSHRVYEDDDIVAFLDIGPVRPGHTQIVPRRHFACFEDLPEDLAGAILARGQILARAMKTIYGVPRVAFMFTGTDIAHAHAHVIPMVAPTDVTSRRYIAEEALTFRPLPRPSDDELAATVAALKAASGA